MSKMHSRHSPFASARCSSLSSEHLNRLGPKSPHGAGVGLDESMRLSRIYVSRPTDANAYCGTVSSPHSRDRSRTDYNRAATTQRSTDFDKVPTVCMSHCACTFSVESPSAYPMAGGRGLPRSTTRSSRPSTTTYELSEDLQAREVEFIERCYGGRFRAQRAARLIQSRYREYRIHAQYARLRAEKRSSRHVDCATPVSFPALTAKSNSLMAAREHLTSMEDLVLDRAYLDWETEVANSALHGEEYVVSGKANRASAPSAPQRESSTGAPAAGTVSTSCTALAPKPGQAGATGSTSGFVSSPGSSSSVSSGCGQKSTPVSAEETALFMHPLEHGAVSHFQNAALRKLSSPESSAMQAGNASRLPQLQEDGGYTLLLSDASSVPRNASSGSKLYEVISSSSLGNHSCSEQPVIFSLAGHENSVKAGYVPVKLVYQVSSSANHLGSGQPAAVLVRRSSSGSGATSGLIKSSPGKPVAAQLWYRPDGTIVTTPYHHSGEAVVRQTKRGPAQGQPVHSHTQHAVQTPYHQQQPSTPGMQRYHRCSHASTSQAHDQQHPMVFKLQSPSSHSSSIPAIAILPESGKAPQHNIDRRRRRIYRICLNFFNKSPVKGIDLLIKLQFLSASPQLISRFLMTRRGLSRSAIGDYLGDTKSELAVETTRQFIRDVDFRDQEVDEAVRSMMVLFRTPGESQKILHLLTEFQSAYVEQNPARVKAQFRSPDSVMILAYAIMMLHTDMYSPNIRPQTKMTRDEFVKNLRGIDNGEDLDRNLLLAIYDRTQAKEMSVLPDHTDQVRRIERLLTGPLRPPTLLLPQRRFVCYCRLFEVPDKSKRDRVGAHQREIFLFNDLLLVTKAMQKRRKEAECVYQVRFCTTLLGLCVVPFENVNYPHGIELSRSSERSGGEASTSSSLVVLNTKTGSDRARLLDDIQECICEANEMDRLRLDGALARQASATSEACCCGTEHSKSQLNSQSARFFFEPSSTKGSASNSLHHHMKAHHSTSGGGGCGSGGQLGVTAAGKPVCACSHCATDETVSTVTKTTSGRRSHSGQTYILSSLDGGHSHTAPVLLGYVQPQATNYHVSPTSQTHRVDLM